MWDSMRQQINSAFGATVVVGLTIWWWRVAIDFGAWGMLSLFPLAVFMFAGAWDIALAPREARVQRAVRKGSSLHIWCSGRLGTSIVSTVFATVGIMVLAWQTLKLPSEQIGLILAAVFVAGFVYGTGQRFAARHFNRPFDREYASRMATWLVSIPVFFVTWYGIWAWGEQPGTMLEASFVEAIEIGRSQVPAARGILSEVLSVPFAYDGAKLWAVVQLREHPFIALLFSADAALFSFVVVRTGVVVTHFLQSQIFERTK
ncbi:hypothetical protein R3X27_03595 [Tropicimonas sp. TH_r6]|uniref:hypothetical protein n=1 Tax=Tropicimonas sp. TH_r6 TaxID=3082085 RepID=UPI0029541B3C|nr:hypothetical protein [Tropicimonas sp. TH_r6]MDV7141760.1 hypothetical protein [Tropicimonas sp. TH_r6]